MKLRDRTWPVAFIELSAIVKPCSSGVCGLNALSDFSVEEVQSAIVLYLPHIVDIQLTGPWHHCSSRYYERLSAKPVFFSKLPGACCEM